MLIAGIRVKTGMKYIWVTRCEKNIHINLWIWLRAVGATTKLMWTIHKRKNVQLNKNKTLRKIQCFRATCKHESINRERERERAKWKLYSIRWSMNPFQWTIKRKIEMQITICVWFYETWPIDEYNVNKFWCEKS